MSYAPALRRALMLLAASLLTSSWLPAQTVRPSWIGESTDATVERALSSRVTLALSDVTMQELAAHLRTRFHINVMLDRRALDDVGLDADTRLSGIECSNVLLEDALELLLDQVELSFYIRSDMLILTTPEETENHLDTVVYPVADLVATLAEDKSGQHREYLDYDTLIETITSVVAPDTWDEVGGAGAIESFPASRALVVSQVRSVQRDVRALLAQLRQSRTVQHVERQAAAPEAVSEARPPRVNSLQSAASRHTYRPSGAWSVPRRHD